MLVQRQNLSSTVWMKKKNCHIGVTITTNWPLHLDLTAQLMVIPHSTFSRIWRYYCGDCHTATKFIEKCSWECNYSMRIPIETIISSMVFVQVGLMVTPAIPVSPWVIHFCLYQFRPFKSVLFPVVLHLCRAILSLKSV
jgi:hypothetical protein